MKKYFLIVITLVICSCNSTTLPLSQYDPDHIKDGVYFKDTENLLKPFIGTWKWQKQDSILIIKFTKLKKWKNPVSTWYNDMVVGRYLLVVGKDTITNTLENNDDRNILSNIDIYPYKNLRLVFTDEIKNKSVRGNFTLESKNKAEFEIFDIEQIPFNGQNRFQQGFSLPKKIIFEKE